MDQVDEEREELVIEIPKENSLKLENCIYNIPTTIPIINKKAYTPQVISIGPIHHGKKRFDKMENQKLIYFKEFCKRMSGKTEKEVVSDFSSIIRDHKDRISSCYVDNSNFGDTSKFVKMVLLDAVFIIEFVLRGLDSEYKNDFIIGQPTLRKVVVLDLLLLENQLPYFILNVLYAELKVKAKFSGLVCECFTIYNQNEVYKSLKDDDILHFVGLMRYFLCGASRASQTWSPDHTKLKYSASKLHQAGVVFKVAEGSKSLLDIEFDVKSGVLKMPVLEINENFEIVFRNVMALEQCQYQYESYICNYIFLMDHLINTAEDVDLLTDAGIIIHWLGSNKMMANLINNLCQGMDVYGSCYTAICQKLNKYYKSSWNRRKATLKLVYFSNLWRGTATIAAALLLIMTLAQTISSIKSLF
ncbi:hypothetical protein GH714_036008 [Hevea brasiliensis]|uniref:Uncharacterized protein n=1 Tax=Hevea brasiliensis TaxID=3981 RepID=A0A6A6N9S2_HEVBR|nr:hypothetical protein GH714_036008 [Hevea brasiliensis]